MSSLLIHPTDRIFIAGALGMAGGAISRALLKAGYQKQLKPNRQELDLTDGEAVKEWLKKEKPDVVVLAAAKVGGIHANKSYPVEFLLENLKIQNNVIEQSYLSGVRRLMFLGSSCIYPKYAKQPICEESLLTGSLEETNEWYAIAKIAGIKLLSALRHQYDFDGLSMMPTNLYGPGDNYHSTNSHVLPGLIDRFHKAKVTQKPFVECWGTGSPLREFLHANDLGEACVFALEKWDPKLVSSPRDSTNKPLEFLNVGSGVELSIKDLAEIISKVIEYKGNIIWDHSKPDGTPRKRLDISQLSDMGWKAKVRIKEGIMMAYDDYLKGLSLGNLRD